MENEETSRAIAKKKSRKKKIRDKWSLLHFVPLDVINYKSSRGRIGLKIYKDLLCKVCDAVGHTRNSLKLHNEIYHRRDSGSAPAPVKKVNPLRNKYKKRKTTVLCTVDLDDDEDDDEEEDEAAEEEIVIDCGESLNKTSEKNDEIEILEDDVAVESPPVSQTKPSVKNTDSTELELLANMSAFQPEVSLWNGLNKAIKKAQKSKSPSPALNRTFTKKYCEMKDRLVSVIRGSSSKSKEKEKKKDEDEILLLETPPSSKKESKNKNNKRPLSSLKKSVTKSIDWSSIITQKPNLNESIPSSPVRKKPFKPVSLLDKFNDSTSTKDDSGYVGSPSPITSKNPPPRPQIRVRDFANTLHEPDVSSPEPEISVLIDENDANNSTSQMFMDIVSSPTIQELGKKKKKTIPARNDSLEDNDVSIISVGEDIQEVSPENISVIPHIQADPEDEDDIIVEDNQVQVLVRKITEDSNVSPKSRCDNFLNQLHSFSKRKFTSTPKAKPVTDIQIVEIL